MQRVFLTIEIEEELLHSHKEVLDARDVYTSTESGKTGAPAFMLIEYFTLQRS
jgi:hypothetical protein